jgi:hypothetical protein
LLAAQSFTVSDHDVDMGLDAKLDVILNDQTCGIESIVARELVVHGFLFEKKLYSLNFFIIVVDFFNYI